MHIYKIRQTDQSTFTCHIKYKSHDKYRLIIQNILYVALPENLYSKCLYIALFDIKNYKNTFIKKEKEDNFFTIYIYIKKQERINPKMNFKFLLKKFNRK